MGSCDVLLGNVCLNGVRAVATVFSYSKNCTCPCEFCLQGQSLIWRDAAKLPTSIFSLSEGRHHFSSVGSAMLLTSSDKDTWRSLGCKLAMFQGEHLRYLWRVLWPASSSSWESTILAFEELSLEAVKGYILSSLKHRWLEMHSGLIVSHFFLMEWEQSLNKMGFVKKLPVTLVKLFSSHLCIKKL